MKTRILNTFGGLLAAWALLPATIGSADNQVTRPFMWWGGNVIVVDMSTVFGTGAASWWIEAESGQGTHVGAYICQGGGTLDFVTGLTTGKGCLIASDGERLFWTLSQECGSPEYTLTITGGTGRFENAAGLWTGWTTPVESVQVGALLYMTNLNEGAGTITY